MSTLWKPGKSWSQNLSHSVKEDGFLFAIFLAIWISQSLFFGQACHTLRTPTLVSVSDQAIQLFRQLNRNLQPGQKIKNWLDNDKYIWFLICRIPNPQTFGHNIVGNVGPELWMPTISGWVVLPPPPPPPPPPEVPRRMLLWLISLSSPHQVTNRIRLCRWSGNTIFPKASLSAPPWNSNVRISWQSTCPTPQENLQLFASSFN